MDEVVYLQQAGALVSANRIEINGHTFAVRNVGSVKVVETARTWRMGVFLLAIGLATWTANAFFSVGVLALAGYVLWIGAPKFSLVLVAGGGEVVAVTSPKSQDVETIRDAVVKAISAR